MNEQEYRALLSSTRQLLYNAGVYPTLHGAQTLPREKRFVKARLLKMVDKLCAADLYSLEIICNGLIEDKAPNVRIRKGAK